MWLGPCIQYLDVICSSRHKFEEDCAPSNSEWTQRVFQMKSDSKDLAFPLLMVDLLYTNYSLDRPDRLLIINHVASVYSKRHLQFIRSQA